MSVDIVARGLASKALLNSGIPGPKGDSFTYNDLTTEQIQDIRSGITAFNTIIRGEETKIGTITLFNLDYDLYQMIIDIVDIPTILNAEATFTLSEIPLGFNLYLKTDSLVVAQESSSGMTEFYNNCYDISRLFVDSDLSTKITIKCIKEVTASVKATIQIEYIKDFGDILTLDVTVPEGINPAEVNLTFPKLKYNKKNLSTFLVEDSAHCWNLFSSMNKKWVDDEKLSFFIPGDDRNFAYHKDFTYVKDDITYTKSTGSYPSKAYEYTDGAGIKHRYAFTIDTWAWTITQSGKSWASTVVNADELCYMQDFGVTAMLHDIKGVADLTPGEQIALIQSKFDEYVDIDENTLKSFTGRYAKGGSTAAGNVVYLKYLNYPKTNYVLSTGNPAGAVKYKPFSDGSSPDKLTNRLLGTALVSPYTLTSFLDEISANASGPLADRELNFLFIDRVATVDSGYPAFLQSLDALIGEAGDDSLLFASIDEIYEYWFMSKFAKYYKTINGQNISYKIHVPCNHNFWFKNISCLLSGIASTSGVTVTSSDNCNGTSFGISDNQLLINLDFSTDLLTKVEKYLTVYENNPSQEYAYDDALYFIQMLKPGVREPYQTRLDLVIPGITPTPTPTNTPVGPTNTPTPTVIETATPTPVPTVTPTLTPTTTTAVVSLSYGFANGNLIYTTLGDTTYNVTTAYAVVSNPPKQLKDKTGTLIPWYWELNKDLFIANAETTATSSLLIGADCGTPGDTGPYPGSMLMANFMTNGNTSDTLKGRMLLTLPIGTYKMKIVYHSGWMSTKAPYLPYCFYKVNVNGVSGTPVQAGPTGFDSETNLDFNAEIDFTVGAGDTGTANVALYLWNTYDGGLNGRPGANLLEIQKLA